MKGGQDSMKVYIARIKKILPPSYDLDYISEKIYPKELAGEKITKLVKKFAKNMHIKQKPTAIDLDSIPEIKLKRKEDHPKEWGKKIVKKLSEKIGIENIGFLSVAYNVTYNKDFLPNLTSQIVMETGLKTDIPPEELAYYGCAAGVISLKNAAEFCKKFNKAAISFTFDQCSNIASFIYDPKNPMFKEAIKSNLLFSDGGVGILLIPESMKSKFDHPLIELIEFKIDHVPGNTIRMENGVFVLENSLKDEIPPIVSEKVIKPILSEKDIPLSDIKEWALHQGGPAILEEFKKPEILGLSEEQLSTSYEMFNIYGNMSAPSCLLVLDKYFSNKENKSGTKGMIVGFGAGYYMASALYKWE